MSGVDEWPVSATARLHCDARSCDAAWQSDVYVRPRSAVAACAPAFAAGWRVYAGQRQQFTYCPEHGPRSEMRQVFP